MSQLTEARTLNVSIIEVADQHTVLDHIGKKANVSGKSGSGGRPTGKAKGIAPLPLESEKSYCQLLERMGGKPITYRDVRGSDGIVLRQLRPGYEDHKFWHHIVPRRALTTFPSLAWARLLPIEARLTHRVTYIGDPGWGQRFSPVPLVLLCPYGWSTLLSLQVTGAHSIQDLGDFVQRLFTARCVQVDGTAAPVSLDQYMLDVGEGVRSDAFGAGVRDVTSPELVAVTAVLSKSGASPALGALTADDQTLMIRLVRPDGRPSADDFADYVVNLVPPDGLHYLLRAHRKYFLWFESKLGGDKRSGTQLECYFNNTFSSVLRTSHLQTLLNQATMRPHNPALDQLVASATDEVSRIITPGDDELTSPYYRNAALKDFSITADLQRSLKGAQKTSP